MEISDVLRSAGGGTEVDIIVSPNSGRRGIDGVDEWRRRVIVRVKSPPLDGRANKEAVDALEDVFRAKCTITRGHSCRQKTVFVPCPPEKVSAVLEVYITARREIRIANVITFSFIGTCSR